MHERSTITPHVGINPPATRRRKSTPHIASNDVRDVIARGTRRADAFVMRTHLALVSSVIILSLASFACGSDGNSDGQSTDGQPSSPASNGKDGANGTNGSPSSSSSSGAPAAGTPAQPTSPGSPAGTATAPPNTQTPPSSSGGTPPASSSSGGTPAATAVTPDAKCDANSIKETESNNTADTANAITVGATGATFCGSLALADVDHFSFTFPADATAFAWKASWSGNGTPKIAITVDGVAVPEGSAPPIKPGKVYDFKIDGAADTVDYVIALGVAH
jgi:hypothetical protein